MKLQLFRVGFAISLAVNIYLLAKISAPWIHEWLGHPRAAINLNMLTVQTSRFESLSIGETDVCIFGDSMAANLSVDVEDRFTEGDLDAKWATALASRRFHSRCIPSATTIGLLQAVPSVVALKPSKIVVWCGVNDLASGRPSAAVSETFSAILGQLRSGAPDAEIFVISVLPVVGRNDVNVAERELNDQLAMTVPRVNAKFLDIRDLVTSAGEIRPDLTIDGTHLMPNSYQSIEKRLVGALFE